MTLTNDQQSNADIVQLHARLAGLEAQTTLLEGQIAVLQNANPPEQNIPQVENEIRNGDAAHSWYTHESTAVVGDEEFECWQVYTHSTPGAGQKLKEDSVFSGALLINSTALPDPGRSDTPTTDPNWDRANGQVQVGSLNSIDFPLPENRAFPGRTMYVGLILARASADVIFSGALAVGLWDNTAGQRKFIEASFSITADTVGVPASTVSSDYFAIANTDTGKAIASGVITVNRPADASFISGSVYERISWKTFAGLSSVDIYRKTGAVYVKLRRTGAAGQYFDDGYVDQTVGAFPPGDVNVEQALTQTRAGELSSLPIDGVSAAWKTLVNLRIVIPSSYNQGNTTDKQWLRIFLTEVPTGVDAAHGILVDLVYLSYVQGVFAHNRLDVGARNPASAPAGSSQGGSGTGGGGDDPFGCIWEDAEVLTVDNRLRFKRMPASTIEKGTLVVSPANDQFFIEPVRQQPKITTQKSLIITVEGGAELRSSLTEPYRSDHGDVIASQLKRGDLIEIYDEVLDQFVFMKVTRIRKAPTCKVVMITLSGRRKYFMAANPGSAGMFVVHNLKPLDTP